jgi:hypothetical protein
MIESRLTIPDKAIMPIAVKSTMQGAACIREVNATLSYVVKCFFRVHRDQGNG